jgi:hypothetical protein
LYHKGQWNRLGIHLILKVKREEGDRKGSKKEKEGGKELKKEIICCQIVDISMQN